MSRKRNWRLVLGVMAIAALAVADVHAQGRGGGRGGGRRGGGPGGGRLDSMMLLQIDEVKEEIELSETQADDIKKAAQEQSAQRREQRGDDRDRGRRRGRDMSDEEREAFFAERRKQAEAQSKKEKAILADILLPHQLERLDQIAIQLQGSRALTDKTVAAKIGLSSDDIQGIEETLREAQDAMREKLFANGRPGREDFMAKIQEARKELDEKVIATLTDEQKSKFDELKGEAFDLSLEKIMRSRRGGPGRGGPGRGGPGARDRRGRGGGDADRGRPRRPSREDDSDDDSDS